MSAPTTQNLGIQDIPGAGRGVLALRSIPKDTELLKSGPPTAHVIFRQYRKEICARCFHYDRGRTLSTRHASTGKIFCSADCRDEWLEEEGELGVRAWECLHAFIQSRIKTVSNCYECLPDRGAKPSRGDTAEAWRKAEEQANPSPMNGKKKRSDFTKTVDPDILGYLVSNVLFYHRAPDKWRESVLALALDEEPYRSDQELTAHTDSFVNLTNLLPKPLLKSCSAGICHLAIAAASHNSFGIRSDDGEEYMGYALYPSASYFNHSCAMNVSKRRVGTHWIFTADREIQVGEECCITYLGGDEKDMGIGERRERLKEHWGFECMCMRCREEGHLKADKPRTPTVMDLA